MPLLTDALRAFWIPGIQNSEADLNLTLTAWLKNVNYYVDSVTSSEEFSIQFSSLDEVTPLFAATSNRALSGCFESVASIERVTRSPRSVAWLLVKLYYAAFFAAHGHMRACGISCTNLDALDAVRIFDTARTYGATKDLRRITPGRYLLRLDPATITLSFSTVNAHGSHQALWRTYKGFIEQASTEMQTSIMISEQKNYVLGQLLRLQDVLCFRGMNDGNWLSQFRNAVQYRHSYGAWHPYSLSKSTPPKMIDSIVAAFTRDPEISTLRSQSKKPEDEIEVFYDCTMFLSAVARATAIDLATRSTNRKSVVRRGAITFLRLSKFDRNK